MITIASDAYRFLGTALKPPNYGYSLLDKEGGVAQYISYMLDRTNRMFEYTGLPPTIPAYILEFFLQSNGQCCITQANPKEHQYALDYASDVSVTLQPAEQPETLAEGQELSEATGADSSQLNPDSEASVPKPAEYTGPPNLYIFTGSPGGAPDIYYRPTQYIIANPQLSQSLNRTIGKDCELIRNDMAMNGLLPLFLRYATQLVENDISIRAAQINSRQRSVISVATDAEKESAELYVQRMEEGRIGIITETPFVEGVKVQSSGPSQPNSIIQLIELQQYLKASWFNELGLNSNFNMKREYLSEEEIASSTDMLLPLVDEMFYCRQVAVDRINHLYGTKIEVQKGSAWANKNREVESSLEAGEAASSQTKPESLESVASGEPQKREVGR